MAGVSLTTVVQLQLQNGTWKLSTLAVGMATTKRDLEAKCPVPLTSSATMATVWATVIGITVLKQVEPFSAPSPHSSPLSLSLPSLFTTIPTSPLTLHHYPYPSPHSSLLSLSLPSLFTTIPTSALTLHHYHYPSPHSSPPSPSLPPCAGERV